MVFLNIITYSNFVFDVFIIAMKGFSFKRSYDTVSVEVKHKNLASTKLMKGQISIVKR